VASASTNDIEFRSVTKSYGFVTAVTDINLNVPKGAFLALLGPSGCGKTTCLRMIGGFEQPSEGTVLIDGREMNGVPAYRRPVNMVFQHYALFPHFNVEQNVAYGLRQMRPRIAAGEINRRVGEALEMVRLGGFAKRRIHEMSGGQQQRVALARAIVNRPSVLLLDEPLAALDKKLRSAMQIELQTLQRELGITFVLVTHDQEEALSMADIVCVMSAGRIRQLGSPQEVYDRPADLFVADFVGKTNRVDATMEADGRTLRLGDGSALCGVSAAERIAGAGDRGDPPGSDPADADTGGGCGKLSGNGDAPYLPRLVGRIRGNGPGAWRFSGDGRSTRYERERAGGAGRNGLSRLQSGRRPCVFSIQCSINHNKGTAS
jgi:spermidine/putrescine transport system ATP-binding protein